MSSTLPVTEVSREHGCVAEKWIAEMYHADLNENDSPATWVKEVFLDWPTPHVTYWLHWCLWPWFLLGSHLHCDEMVKMKLTITMQELFVQLLYSGKCSRFKTSKCGDKKMLALFLRDASNAPWINRNTWLLHKQRTEDFPHLLVVFGI